MPVKIPIRFLSYRFPLLHVCNSVVLSSWSAANESFDLTVSGEAKKVIDWVAAPGEHELWEDSEAMFSVHDKGTYASAQDRWMNGQIEDVVTEFELREMRLHGMMCVIVAMRHVLQLDYSRLPVHALEEDIDDDLRLLHAEIAIACGEWNESSRRLFHYYNEKRDQMLEHGIDTSILANESPLPSPNTPQPFDIWDPSGTLDAIHVKEYFEYDGSNEHAYSDLVSKLKEYPIEPKQPARIPLVGIPSFSSAKMVEDQLNHWVSWRTQQKMEDLDYLVWICDKTAPSGMKSWHWTSPGDIPSLSQLYRQSYLLRKVTVVNELAESLSDVLAENQYPPRTALLHRLRALYQRWNDIAKEIQHRIREESVKPIPPVPTTASPMSEQSEDQPAAPPDEEIDVHMTIDSPESLKLFPGQDYFHLNGDQTSKVPPKHSSPPETPSSTTNNAAPNSTNPPTDTHVAASIPLPDSPIDHIIIDTHHLIPSPTSTPPSDPIIIDTHRLVHHTSALDVTAILEDRTTTLDGVERSPVLGETPENVPLPGGSPRLIAGPGNLEGGSEEGEVPGRSRADSGRSDQTRVVVIGDEVIEAGEVGGDVMP